MWLGSRQSREGSESAALNPEEALADEESLFILLATVGWLLLIGVALWCGNGMG